MSGPDRIDVLILTVERLAAGIVEQAAAINALAEAIASAVEEPEQSGKASQYMDEPEA